ncbi:MAG: hypothetical protein QM498_04030 [Desulfobacterium sp.]
MTIIEAQYAGAQRHHKYMEDTEYRKKCGVRVGAESLLNEVALINTVLENHDIEQKNDRGCK